MFSEDRSGNFEDTIHVVQVTVDGLMTSDETLPTTITHQPGMVTHH